MRSEIEELEEYNTWTVIKRSDVPPDKQVIPGTWALKIKRFPDGRLRKFKGRFCARGNKQVEGLTILINGFQQFLGPLSESFCI